MTSSGACQHVPEIKCMPDHKIGSTLVYLSLKRFENGENKESLKEKGKLKRGKK